MANIYEFEPSKEIIEHIVTDVGLSQLSDTEGNIIDNLFCFTHLPTTFLKLKMDERSGICLRIGDIQTERFEGLGLHMFVHSGSEGYLMALEFDRRLKSSLENQGISYTDRSQLKEKLFNNK